MILAGYLILFLVYQLPQGLQEFVSPHQGIWLAATLLFFVAAHFVSRTFGGVGIASYALGWTGGWSVQFAVGVLLGFACAGGAGLASWKLGLYRVDAVLPAHQVILPGALLAFGSLLASLSEDILTRGYVWWQGGKRLRPAAFCVLSAGLYVANHIYVLTRGPALWVFLFLLGLALAYALYRTGSLWLAFGAHWGWNLVFHLSDAALSTTRLAPVSRNTWVSAAGSAALLALVVAISGRLSGNRPRLAAQHR